MCSAYFDIKLYIWKNRPAKRLVEKSITTWVLHISLFPYPSFSLPTSASHYHSSVIYYGSLHSIPLSFPITIWILPLVPIWYSYHLPFISLELIWSPLSSPWYTSSPPLLHVYHYFLPTSLPFTLRISLFIATWHAMRE